MLSTDLETQYIYEKKWLKTSTKEALEMITQEMPETDSSSTLAYIISEVTKGKIVTLGECRFRQYEG